VRRVNPRPIDFASYIGPGYFLRLAALDRAMRHLHGKRFVELGPGRGDVAAWLISRGGRGSLVDTSPASVGYLRSRFKDDTAVMVCEDVAALPGDAAGGFELALAFEVLEHVPDDLGLLKTMHGLLAGGGTLVISVPAFRRRWGELDECVGHLRRYEREDLERVIDAAGFENPDLYCYGFPVCTIFSLLRRIYYRKALKKLGSDSMDDRTGRSGVERPLNVRSRMVVKILYALMLPAIAVQALSLRGGLGEGWIAVARKNSEEAGNA
jgi:SAM-dependent methyltransferase